MRQLTHLPRTCAAAILMNTGHYCCSHNIPGPLIPVCFCFIVLSSLYQKKVIAQHDVQKWMNEAEYMLHNLICDLCTRPSEDVATAADVLDMVGCTKEAEMLRGKLGFVYMHITAIYSSSYLAWQMVAVTWLSLQMCMRLMVYKLIAPIDAISWLRKQCCVLMLCCVLLMYEC